MTPDTQKLRRMSQDLLRRPATDGEATSIGWAAADLDSIRAREAAKDIIVRSVAASLARHGVTEADDPGEAIDVLVADKNADNKRLREALQMMIRAYVNLLECGRDRILDLGGQCDPVDAMEATTPELIAARAALQGESKC